MFRNPLIDAVVVLVIVLLIFGPKRLPELGKGLGRGMREFKEGITGDDKDEERPSCTLRVRAAGARRRSPPAPSAVTRPRCGPDPKAVMRAGRRCGDRARTRGDACPGSCDRSVTRTGSASSTTSMSCARG